ncbi:hypothetical protein ACYOEI_13665 [Singulisphaera rosea]
MILNRLTELFRPKNDPAETRRPTPRRKSMGPQLEPLETRQLLAYSGPKVYGIDYSPTWPGWKAVAHTQFEDSDFFNGSFKGLWGMAGNKGRNDLQTIQGGGYNLVRLYNWSPSRGTAKGKFDAHDVFLKSAKALGLNVMVPVSNFFLSSNQYAWGQATPTADYNYDKAPDAIKVALRQFLDSITQEHRQGGRTTYTLLPGVGSISVGNEFELGGVGGGPNATVKLQRTMWWVVNLQNALVNVRKVNIPDQFLTIPISNADQNDAWSSGTSTGGNGATTLNDTSRTVNNPDRNKLAWTPNSFAQLTLKIIAGTGAGQERTIVSNTGTQITVSSPWATTPNATSQYQVVNPNPVSWFQIFANGVKQGTRVPTGTQPDGPAGKFSSDVKGLSGYSWYNTKFFNSLNMFQTGDQLKNTLTQYDTGTPSGTSWSQMWPGPKMTVPLFITEIGTSRFNISETRQAQLVADQQAQVAENVLKTSTNLMGYTIFEFNDEPGKPGEEREKFYGIYRNGTIKDRLQTGTAEWAGGTLHNVEYPVYNLIPVQYSPTVTLPQRLKSIFSQVK